MQAPALDWFHAWCAAEQAAMEATREASRRWLLALQGNGEAPPCEQVDELKRLRAIANALLSAGVARITAPAGAG